MKNNKIFLIATAIVALLVFGALAFWSGKDSKKKSAEAVEAADSSMLIKPHNFVKGNNEAKVTIVEFLDPECEACRAMHPIMKSLMSEYEGKIKLVIRYMPFHGNSKLAAVMLEEARDQGKYEGALDVLFERQPEWADHAQPRPELIPELISLVGVDKSKLDALQLTSKHGWKVDLDQSDGVKLGVRLTPTFFVNGRMLNEIGYGPIRQAIEAALSDGN